MTKNGIGGWDIAPLKLNHVLLPGEAPLPCRLHLKEQQQVGTVDVKKKKKETCASYVPGLRFNPQQQTTIMVKCYIYFNMVRAPI